MVYFFYKLIKEVLKMTTDKWIRLRDEIPTIEKYGEKILICRRTTKTQVSQARQVFDTSMIKYCNPDETIWMKLPDIPKWFNFED